MGTTYPIAAPRADEATAIVIAATRSLSPNHTAASLAGAFNKKGCPIAANTYPTTQIQNLLFINTLIIIPKVVSKLPNKIPFLHPNSSIT